MTPPTSWATQYVGTRGHGWRPAIASPNVTAGLKCPPDSAPNAEIAMARAMPCANAMGSRPVPLITLSVRMAPAPMKKNQNVPQASAKSARVWSFMGGYSRADGRLPSGRGDEGAHPLHPPRAGGHADRARERRVDRGHRAARLGSRELAATAPSRAVARGDRETDRVGVGLHLGLAVLRARGRGLPHPLRL